MSEIDRAISESTGIDFCTRTDEAIGGGCINQASKLGGVDGREFLLKRTNSLFCLLSGRGTGTQGHAGYTNHPSTQGDRTRNNRTQAYLVLEYIEEGSAGSNGQATLRPPRQNASRCATAFWMEYGQLHRGNPQPNPRSENWPAFYRDHRRLINSISLQIKAENLKAPRNYSNLSILFTSYSPHPSLLHGIYGRKR